MLTLIILGLFIVVVYIAARDRFSREFPKDEPPEWVREWLDEWDDV